MLKVLMCASPLADMAVTMLPLVDALRARGHAVVFMAAPGMRADAELRGATFVPVDAAPLPEATRARSFLPTLQQAKRLVRRRFLTSLEADWSLVRRTLAAERVDVVITDPLFFGASAMAYLPQADRQPVVSLGSVPLFFSDPDAPPYGMGLTPLDGGMNVVRNVLLDAVTRLALNGVTREVNRTLTTLTGAEFTGSLIDHPQRVDVWAQLTVPRFEYPRRRPHPNLRFVGPLRPAEQGVPDGTLPDWWDVEDRRPLVYLRHEAGTPMENLALPAIRGLEHAEVRLVITGAEPAAVAAALGRPLPSNTRVEPSMCYSLLLATAGVAIKAGDYVRTQYALRWGVPLVVAGTAEEQVETNARVEWAGVGVNLRTARPTPTAMHDAVMTVLHDPGMRRAAAKIALQIARTDAEGTLCDLAEELVRTSEYRRSGGGTPAVGTGDEVLAG